MVGTGPEQDYYAILGVGRTASADDLKHAFRTLARRYHPDVNASPDAERRFEEIHTAYAVLSDPTQRRAYDAARAARSSFTPPHGAGSGSPFTPPRAAGAPPRPSAASSFSYSDLFDEFDDVLASLGAKPRPRASDTPPTHEVPVDERDVEDMVSVSLEEAARGTTKRVTISRLEPCPRCHGAASASPRLDTCPTCNGEQWLTSASGGLPKICPTCNGSGMTFATTCAECGGRGRIRRAHTLAVTIPAGIADGQHIRLAGQGNVGTAGEAPGNLIVTVRVRPHPRFRREGDDVHLDLPLTPEQLANGAKVEIEALYGRGMLTIPKGTRVGATFRLGGKGMPHLRGGGHGDQYVHVRARTPGDLFTFTHVGATRPSDLFVRERERIRGWTRNARRRFGPARRRLVKRVRKALG